MSRFGKQYFAIAVCDVLSSIGYDAKLVPVEDVASRALRQQDILFFLDMQSAHAILGRRMSRSERRPRATSIYFNMEPLPDREYEALYHGRFRRYKRALDQLRPDVIFDYNQHTTRYLNRRRSNAHHCPIAYHESYDLHGEGDFPDAVQLLGDEVQEVKTDRSGVPFRTVLSRRGVVCKAIRDAGVPCNSYNFREDPEALERLNLSAGIHLNAHHVNPPFNFGGIRVIIMGMANKRFVMSEPCVWHPPGLKSGEHWVVVNTEDIPEQAAYWMDRKKEREEIGRAGYEFMKTHHRLDVALPKALESAGLFHG